MQKLRFILCLKYHQDSPKFWTRITSITINSINLNQKKMHLSKKFYKMGFVKNHKIIIIGSDLMQQFLQLEITLQKNYSSRDNLILL